MRYKVRFKIEGYDEFDVEANNTAEAAEKATEEFIVKEYPGIDVEDGEPVHIEDACGNIYD